LTRPESMRRRASCTALLLLLTFLLSFALGGRAEVDGGEDGEAEDAANTVGLEYDDDYDPAVGKGGCVDTFALKSD
jgi:hypothetical protein